VCLYNIEERSQRFIPGLDGSERITALAVSRSKRYIAIAEATDKTPLCSIYDLQTLKRRKLLASTEIKDKSYCSIAFSQTNMEKMLVTLTEKSTPEQTDQTVYVWQWDKSKCLCLQTIQHPLGDIFGTQVSFSNTDHNIVLVTGKGTY